MTTSGTHAYARTVSQIIATAYRKCGVGLEGETLGSNEIEDALEALNLMMGEWIQEGVKLQKIREMVVWLQVDETRYSLGATGDHATVDVIVNTTLSAAGATNDTTLSYTSTTGMAASDNIGIVLDDNTIHWDTIASISPVVLTTGITGAAASGNKVFAYTNKAPRPVKVLEANYVYSTETKVPIVVSDRNEIFYQTTETSGAQIVYVAHDPQIDDSILHAWPPAKNEKDRLELIVKIPIEVAENVTQTMDVPREQHNALVWNLAEELKTEIGVEKEMSDRIERRSARSLQVLLDFDSETASVRFEPYMEGEIW